MASVAHNRLPHVVAAFDAWCLTLVAYGLNQPPNVLAIRVSLEVSPAAAI
jgi:hypothetical protein